MDLGNRQEPLSRTGYHSRQQSLGAVSQLGAPSPAISGQRDVYVRGAQLDILKEGRV